MERGAITREPHPHPPHPAFSKIGASPLAVAWPWWIWQPPPELSWAQYKLPPSRPSRVSEQSFYFLSLILLLWHHGLLVPSGQQSCVPGFCPAFPSSAAQVCSHWSGLHWNAAPSRRLTAFGPLFQLTKFSSSSRRRRLFQLWLFYCSETFLDTWPVVPPSRSKNAFFSSPSGPADFLFLYRSIF